MSRNESLDANSNYPPMSQIEWDNAPFNQVDPPEEEFDAYMSQSLSKRDYITTNQYESDYDGIDKNSIDWKECWTDKHYTPIELIHKLEAELVAQLNAGGKLLTIDSRQFDYLIDECKNWVVDEEEFYY